MKSSGTNCVSAAVAAPSVARTAKSLMAEAVGYLLPLVGVGAFGIYVKAVSMSGGGGYLTIARFVGRTEIPGAAHLSFSWLERASLYREDILVNLVALPAVCLFVLMALPRRLWSVFILTLSAVLLLWYFTAMLANANVGRFLTMEMLVESIAWVSDHPHQFFDYASPSSLVKLLMLVALICACIWLLRYRLIAATSGWIAVAAAAGGVAASAVGQGVTLPAAAAYDSVLQQSVRALIVNEEGDSRLAGVSAAEVNRQFEALSGTPTVRSDALFGRAPGRDVILFILETSHAGSAKLEKLLSPSEVLSPLTGSAIVAKRHFSTYPYTSDATFSIFSSLYPIGRKKIVREADPATAIGWPALLRMHGYATRTYAAYGDTFEPDTAMYRAVGFDVEFQASEADPASWNAGGEEVERTLASFPNRRREQDAMLRDRLQRDHAAFLKMSADVLAMKEEGRRFVASIQPQIGHGPWFDLMGSGLAPESDATLVKLQMSWLRRLVDELQARRKLASTVIVVVADHGPRTRTELPSLQHGAITPISVHVPMLIYADGVWSGTQTIEHASSHVDIGPTILALLGIDDRRAYIHGRSLGTSGLDGRTVFFFGRNYLGADGYYGAGEFTSCEYFAGSCIRHALGETPRRVESNAVEVLEQVRAMQRRTVDLLAKR